MPVCQLGVQIEQVGIWLDAIDATCSDQAREPCSTTGSVIVTGKKCVAACHGGASDRIFDQIGIHVDMAIVQEQTESVLTSQHVCQYGNIVSVYTGNEIAIVALTDDGIDEIKDMLKWARESKDAWHNFLEDFVADPEIIARVKDQGPR